MSRFDDLQNRVKNFFGQRAKANGLDSEVWKTFPSLRTTASGVHVSDELALRTSAVYACIRVLAETMASLPLKLYRRTSKNGRDGKEVADKHPLYDLIHSAPNDIMTSYEFRETMMTHLNLRGNFYAVKEFNGAGDLANLSILHPGRMTVVSKGSSIAYEYIEDDGKKKVQYSADEIWHVRCLSSNGIIGLSPVSQAKEAIGLSVSLEAHGSRLFKNDARPGGVLTSIKSLKEEAAARLSKRWQDAHTSGNAWKVAVLEEGMDYKPIGFSNDDAQFLETRNFQIQDIARMFRVPTVMIGHPDGTSTYASVEQFFLSFMMHTVRPWAIRIEQSINRHLLSEKDRRKYFAEFQLDALLRGDLYSRYQAYAIARQNMWMSANEIRAKENMNPIEDGDKYENPNTTAQAKPPTV